MEFAFGIIESLIKGASKDNTSLKINLSNSINKLFKNQALFYTVREQNANKVSSTVEFKSRSKLDRLN